MGPKARADLGSRGVRQHPPSLLTGPPSHFCMQGAQGRFWVLIRPNTHKKLHEAAHWAMHRDLGTHLATVALRGSANCLAISTRLACLQQDRVPGWVGARCVPTYCSSTKWDGGVCMAGCWAWNGEWTLPLEGSPVQAGRRTVHIKQLYEGQGLRHRSPGPALQGNAGQGRRAAPGNPHGLHKGVVLCLQRVQLLAQPSPCDHIQGHPAAEKRGKKTKPATTATVSDSTAGSICGEGKGGRCSGRGSLD